MNADAGTSSGKQDPLAGFDFAKLIASAAKLRPERVALTDHDAHSANALTFAELERAVVHSAALWRDAQMPEGACVLIVAGARVAPVIAVLGALHAGLDVALVPSHMDAEAIADFIRATGAQAICSEPANGGLDLAAEIFAAASLAGSIRLVATLGDRPVDGALNIDIVDFKSRTLTHPPQPSARKSVVLTITSSGGIASHSQHALMSAALDFIAEARIGMRLPIVSTISIASLAGIVAGPIAGFMSGAPVILHGPFDSSQLGDLLTLNRQANVVVPAAVAPAICDAGLVAHGDFAALIVLHRHDEDAEPNGDAEGVDLPVCAIPDSCTSAIIDLHAFGEYQLSARTRDRMEPAVIQKPNARTVIFDRMSRHPVERRRIVAG
jgi:acyl-CoA synthetase (AMP-forming)/AMP-acid ligase II